MYKYLKFTKQIDRRSPRNEGDIESPILRENWLSRDGILRRPKGAEPLNYYSAYQFDSYTKLLVHFRDTFKDELGNTPTIHEGAYIDKTDGAFGTVGCGYFDGSDDYLSYAASNDWYFGTGDFTIRVRFKISDLTNAQVIVGQYKDATNYWYIKKDTSANGNKFSMKFVFGGATKGDYEMTSSLGIIANRWYALEFCRSTTTCKCLLDGELITLTENTAFGANDVGDLSAYVLDIGAQNSASYFTGRLDELRLDKGVARNTAAYTIPTKEFEPDQGVQALTSRVTWMHRYYTAEIGQQTPKTFAYSQDGKLWLVDDTHKTITEIKSGLEPNARPKSCVFKYTEQYILYLVDGKNLYKYDGNNDNEFEKVTITDPDDDTIEPIDIIEHKDRLVVIDKTYVYLSANLDPDNFNSSTDAIAIIAGSGQGENKAVCKIEDKLYVLTSEGIFVLQGDVISALAVTFELRLVESRRIVAGGSAQTIEAAIVFLADDLELYSFNGNSSTLLSYYEKLSDFIHPDLDMLNKATSTWEDDYYKLSFVERGSDGYPRLEVWWDALEQKMDFVRGRNVGCYMKAQPSREKEYRQFGRSDVPKIMWADRGFTFDGNAIETKLWTKDITVEKGLNVRFTAFYPEF